MTLHHSGTPRAICDTLRHKPALASEAVKFARHLAGNDHAGDVALLRLQEKGYVVLEYRLTDEGLAALGACGDTK